MCKRDNVYVLPVIQSRNFSEVFELLTLICLLVLIHTYWISQKLLHASTLLICCMRIYWVLSIFSLRFYLLWSSNYFSFCVMWFWIFYIHFVKYIHLNMVIFRYGFSFFKILVLGFEGRFPLSSSLVWFKLRVSFFFYYI